MKETIYFYGLAANPLTLAHEEIIKGLVATTNNVIIAVADHDYKKIEMPIDIRLKYVQTFMENNFPDNKEQYKIIVQNKRTYDFLTSNKIKVTDIVVGTDEYEDLKAGKWARSQDIFANWNINAFSREDNAISSTKARELLKNNADDSELLKYISPETLKICKEFLNATIKN